MIILFIHSQLSKSVTMLDNKYVLIVQIINIHNLHDLINRLHLTLFMFPN